MFFNALKPKKIEPEPNYNQALIISIDVSGTDFGTGEEQGKLVKLEDEISDKLEGSGIGFPDGHEFGDGEFTMYFYGENTDKLLSRAEPLLKASKYRPIRIHQRYGPVDDKKAREKKTRIF